MPDNSSINSGHYNFRRINSETFEVFLNTTLDSVIVCNWSTGKVDRILLPFTGHIVHLLYFHNPDSIFLFIDREFVYKYNPDDPQDRFVDLYLLNNKGEMVNEYSFDNIPHIYSGQIDPMIFIRPNSIQNPLIYSNEIFLPFNIYLPAIEETSHKELKIQLICKFNLRDQTFRMLDVILPDQIIGKYFKDQRSRSMSVDFLLLSDSLLVFYFENHASIYSYDLNSDAVSEVFPMNEFPIMNLTDTDDEEDRFVSFGRMQYSPVENIYIRSITFEDYKEFRPFQMNQLLDSAFQVIGYQLYDARAGYMLNNRNCESFFFDRHQHLSIRQTNKEGGYYHVRPGTPVMRSMAYIEEHYLKKLDEDVVPMRFSSDTPYEKRMVAYLNELNIPIGSKVILVGLNDACSQCIEVLLNARRQNPESFGSQQIIYLFTGLDPTIADPVFQAYQVPEEFIIVDKQRLFREFFLPEEHTLYPLVHYKASGEVELVIYDFRSCAEDLRQFLEVR